jgi:hypothetical protein
MSRASRDTACSAAIPTGGPIWFPVNYLLSTSLRRFAEYYGPEFRIEYPTGSGASRSIDEVADALRAEEAEGRHPPSGARGCPGVVPVRFGLRLTAP